LKEFINTLIPPLYYECNQKTFDRLKTVVATEMAKVAGDFAGIDIRVVEGKPDGMHPVYERRF
jgi:hypothetical protein